jgi:hypothetical protein
MLETYRFAMKNVQYNPFIPFKTRLFQSFLKSFGRGKFLGVGVFAGFC